MLLVPLNMTTFTFGPSSFKTSHFGQFKDDKHTVRIRNQHVSTVQR